MSALTLALVQSSLYWLDKQANLAHFSELLDDLTEPADLIVLPEHLRQGLPSILTVVSLSKVTLLTG